jgi:phenylacetate-CoA ligase
MTESFLSEHLYPRLPIALQNFACWCYGKKEAKLRAGRNFDDKLLWLLETEHWSRAEIEAYQDEKVRKLIAHSYVHVPFYRERMQQNRLLPSDIRSRQDLYKLPIVTKEDVGNNLERLVSQKARGNALTLHRTSGTTGTALRFYSSAEAISFQWAVWWRHRMRFGLEPGMLHANFTGKRMVPLAQDNPPFWRWNRPLAQALLNVHHLTPAKIGSIIDFLNFQDFKYYSGYPSIIHVLAVTACEAGMSLAQPPKVIVTGAENMLEFQRRDLKAFTHATLTDQYGFSEGCGNASHCEQFVYHEDFEFGILEPHHDSQSAAGREHNILCTGFANFDFPLIRYQVGDSAIWQDAGQNCPCGRHSRVLLAISGRNDDYVVTPEGRRIMRFDYVFKDTPNVKEAQVVQEHSGEISLRIVPRHHYSSLDETVIAQQIRSWISPKLKVNFEYVPEIARASNGKFRAVVSHLAGNQVTGDRTEVRTA